MVWFLTLRTLGRCSVSLSSHLADARSPVRAFLSERFPNARGAGRIHAATLANATSIRPSAPLPYGTIGTALDYRLRYYCALTPSTQLVAWKGAVLVCGTAVPTAADVKPGASTRRRLARELVAECFASLEGVLRQLQPVKRRLERPEEELFARYVIVLALLEHVFRADVRTTPLLAIAQPHWVDDLCALSWAFYARCGDLLARSQDVVLNPTFDGSVAIGGADADLALDHCLIDINTTVKPRIEPTWLYQLLGYVLLDYSDRYRMREVALYLARQALPLRWPIGELLPQKAAVEVEAGRVRLILTDFVSIEHGVVVRSEPVNPVLTLSEARAQFQHVVRGVGPKVPYASLSSFPTTCSSPEERATRISPWRRRSRSSSRRCCGGVLLALPPILAHRRAPDGAAPAVRPCTGRAGPGCPG